MPELKRVSNVGILSGSPAGPAKSIQPVAFAAWCGKTSRLVREQTTGERFACGASEGKVSG